MSTAKTKTVITEYRVWGVALSGESKRLQAYLKCGGEVGWK